jgi:putative transposase
LHSQEQIVIFLTVSPFFGSFEMSRMAVPITLNACEQALLEKIVRQLTVPEYKKQRVRTVLTAASGMSNTAIVRHIGLNRNDVSKWRKRWFEHHHNWQESDLDLRPAMDAKLVLHWLDDKAGRGRKQAITLEQRSKVAGLVQESPEQYGIPVTHWTLDHLAAVAVQRGIIDKISRVSVHRILKKATCRRIGVGTG